MTIQRLYDIWSKDPPGKLMNIKYLNRAKIDYYVSLLSDELRLVVEISIHSEWVRLYYVLQSKEGTIA